jgi:hypothetical protein
MKTWLKVLLILAGIFFLGLAAVITWTSTSRPAENGIWLADIFFVALGLYFLLSAFLSRLVVDDTHIQIRGLLGEKSVELASIKGYRTIESRNASFWKLELKDSKKTVLIRKWFDCAQLREWMKRLTDLDEQGRQEVLSQIEQDQELGATPEERLKKLKTAKIWAVVLSVISIPAALVLFIGIDHWQLPCFIVLALVPAVALLLMNRQPLVFALGKPKRDPRADLSIALLVAGIGLFFSGIQLNFVSIMALAPSFVAIAVAFALGFFVYGRKGPKTPGFVLFVILFAAGYGFGLVAICDTLFDHAQPSPYQVQIVNKHTVSGRSTSYYLDLAPWGPLHEVNKLSVTHDIYDAADPGDVICLEEHPGALRAAWYEMVPCYAPPENAPAQ